VTVTDSRTGRSSRLTLLLLAALGVIVAYFVIEGAVTSADRYLTAQRADTTTTGTWVDVEDDCGRYVAYEVDGQTYRLDTAAGFRQSCTSAREGETIEISYDSSDPARAHRGAGGATGHLVAAGAWVLTGIVLLALTPRFLRTLRADRRRRDPAA